MERFLIDRGQVAESIARKAQQIAIREDRHIGEVLVQMRAVEPNDLFVALKRSLGKSILSIFAWEQGSSQFQSGELDLDQMLVIKVKPAPLILRGVCNFTPMQVIQRDFGDKLDAVHEVPRRRKHELSKLQATTKESRIVNALAEGRTLMQLSEELGEDQELILRILYALSLLGLSESRPRGTGAAVPVPAEPAEPAEPVEPAEPAEPVEPVVSAVLPAPSVNFADPVSPPPPVEVAQQQELSVVEKNDLDAAYLVARTRDYYQLFDIPENFSFAQLRASFLQMCHRFSPMSYLGRDLGDQEERAEELFLAMVHAFSTLAVPVTRAAYIEEYQGRKRAKPCDDQEVDAPTNSFAIKIPPDVASSVRAGLELINQGELSVALSCLSGAYEADPKDAYTCAFLGYALHMAEPISKAKQARELLENSTRLDPTLSYAFLLLGRVAEFQEDRPLALQAYQDCLSVCPTELEAKDSITRLLRLLK